MAVARRAGPTPGRARPSSGSRVAAGGRPGGVAGPVTGNEEDDTRVRCPYCKANNDRVIDSRTSGEADVIRRRRECLECNGRFTTYERVGETPLRVVKKDGTRVPFERGKILRSLLIACQKRPVSTETMESIVTDIETQLHEMFDKEVASKYVGHLVMDALRDVDHVAYVRFASVYREFKDVNEFIDELRPLLGGGLASSDSNEEPDGA